MAERGPRSLRTVARRGVAIGLLGLGCNPPPAGNPPPAPAEASPEAAPAVEAPKWLKGQLHLHSNASGDSQTPPADVARWYAEAGFDFIVFTDHNRITELPGPPGLLVFAGIELTQNLEYCEPPPLPGMSCLLHVNGLFVGSDTTALSQLPGPTSPDRLALFSHAVQATEALGGVAMLDHPNFHYAADADLISALAGRGLTLLEVANEAVDSNNQGDDNHPSTEALWDAVLSTGARVWGVATDDAHHYYDAREVRQQGHLAHVGNRGWVMVRAQADGASIRAAIERGDFYSSNGVQLRDVTFDGATVKVSVADEAKGPHRFAFIGSGGEVLDRQRGREASFTMPDGFTGYVRVQVDDRGGHRAWTQPMWRE